MKSKTSLFVIFSLILHVLLAILFWKKESSVREIQEPLGIHIMEHNNSDISKAPIAKVESENSDLAPVKALEAVDVANTSETSGVDSSSNLPQTVGAKGPSLQLNIEYPPLSVKAREEGKAEYLLELGEDLSVISFKQLRSSGFARLDRAVEKSLLQLKPGTNLTHTRTENLIIDFRLMGTSPKIKHMLN